MKGDLVGRVLFELQAVSHLADAALLPGISVGTDGENARYVVTHMDGLILNVVAGPHAPVGVSKGGPPETVKTLVVEAVRCLTSEVPAE